MEGKIERNSTRMLVRRGPISTAQFRYTWRLTLECRPSRRGPRKNPDPKSEKEIESHLNLVPFLLSLLRLLHNGLECEKQGFRRWRKFEKREGGDADAKLLSMFVLINEKERIERSEKESNTSIRHQTKLRLWFSLPSEISWTFWLFCSSVPHEISVGWTVEL